ncbi:MAG: apolipoprotein N-acyltransferase [Thiobacillaceae bacterium]|nr:apolipoprotein N-acyltransferase [Thiobacillaceae bacterium]MCX7673127.1 apolipoprotein N-acyltransferase [Thiobacillaceae bacterium]MDW8323507.1 apolipoprotein N-acyltransferase [Burkholderiales bacterium]
MNRTTLHRLLPPVLAFALGAVGVFGYAPFYLYPLPILALAGLIHLVRVNGAAFGLAYAYALGAFLAGVSWVYVSMHEVGGMPAPLAGLAVLLFAAYLALFPAAAVGLAARWPLTEGWRWLTAFPALWLVAEWLRGTLLTGFPWLALGYAQAPAGPLSGYAPVFGVYGVGALAAFTAAALALRRWPGLALAAAVWLAGLGLMQLPWTRPVGEPVSVSLLQGNIEQSLKFRPERLAGTLATYRELALASRARLILLPETALPIFLDDVPPPYLAELAAHARAQGGDLVVGVPLREGERYYNAVVTLGSAPAQTYRKVHLVPFGEFVPWGFRWFVALMDIPLGDFARGPRAQPPLAAAGQRLAVNICYEDVFGEELLHALPAATLMVNVSNDAWFGDSLAPWQHLQITQMRALETGRWWLRANNTGITAIVDARGRVRARLPPFTTGALHGSAQGHAGLTPYARWGNAAALAAAGLTLALTGALGRRQRPPG